MQFSEKAQYTQSPHCVDNNFPVPESANRTSMTLYENEIPANIEVEIERLYGNLFSSFVRFKAYGDERGINVFVIQESEKPISIIAFRRALKIIVVLNEQIELREWEINRFSTYMFSHFDSIDSIVFKAIKTNIHEIKYPNHALHFTNDIVISCPDSEQQYLANLGKSTRQNVKYYLKNVKRNFPSFSCEVHEREECNQELFQKIINLNRSRMRLKKKKSGIDQAEEKRLWTMVKTHGVIVAILIDGKICAGTIGYRIGSNFFVRVIAHDSDYSEYDLGILACYLAICEYIKRGSKEVHFLWGREEYKFRLLGEERNFDSITIYRSKWTLLMNGAAILRAISATFVRSAKTWALDPVNKNKFIPRCATLARDFLRATQDRRSKY